MMRFFCTVLILICAIHIARAQEQTFLVDDIPLGLDVPLWVRESWIGLRLPYTEFGECADIGIVTQEPVPASRGYYVYQSIAIEKLRSHAPRAAQWWIDSGFPREYEQFCFPLPKMF